MNIKTKFDVGDKVWIIYSHSEPLNECGECGRIIKSKDIWGVAQRGKITKIDLPNITNSKLDAGVICYELAVATHSSYGTEYHKYEKNLFRTKREAEAECKRRNKEEK